MLRKRAANKKPASCGLIVIWVWINLLLFLLGVFVEGFVTVVCGKEERNSART